MPDIAYRSQVRIERVKGPIKKAWLPVEPDPVTFGVHGAIAEHYKLTPELSPPHSATLDYIVASTAGCLVGTFGGALEARQIPAADGKLSAHAEGEIEKDDGVLVIRRIHVKLHLKADAAHRETAERVLGFYADKCPVYRTLRPAIDITSELVFEQI